MTKISTRSIIPLREIQICGNCGRRITAHHMHCPHCGAYLGY